MSALYKQVSTQILEQITKGERKVGDQFPPEIEFASELGVSRSTVRLAFNELELSGVLRRRKRAGTQIIASKPKTQVRTKQKGFEELMQMVRNVPAKIEQISTVHLDDMPVLEKFHEVSDHWLEIYATRSLPNAKTPTCVSCVYIPERFSAITDNLNKMEASVLSLIENVYDVQVARIVQRDKAVSCPTPAATLMALQPAEAVLEIQMELYDRGGELIEFVVTHAESNQATSVAEYLITEFD